MVIRPNVPDMTSLSPRVAGRHVYLLSATTVDQHETAAVAGSSFDACRPTIPAKPNTQNKLAITRDRYINYINRIGRHRLAGAGNRLRA